MKAIVNDNKIIGTPRQDYISNADILAGYPEYSEEDIIHLDAPVYCNGVWYVDENDPEYIEAKALEERQRLDALTLTPADVERALYKAKGMDFEDLKALIVQELPTVDIKALSIEFRAKDFYRGAMAGGMRLFDVVGALLGYSPNDMDYLFQNKELPQLTESEVE